MCHPVIKRSFLLFHRLLTRRCTDGAIRVYSLGRRQCGKKGSPTPNLLSDQIPRGEFGDPSTQQPPPLKNKAVLITFILHFFMDFSGISKASLLRTEAHQSAGFSDKVCAPRPIALITRHWASTSFVKKYQEVLMQLPQKTENYVISLNISS